ncbi:MAG TPA: hypothetical protein VFC81_01950, partial [Verrucomicrobiae bacterium]|nr:hypothetical protein [Verrucomicrobiae bacterium]
ASSRVLIALVEDAGLAREDAYAIVQAAALRAADERRPLRELLATEPTVAARLSLSRLDACFDDATFLRHASVGIGRLDRLEAELAIRAAARLSIEPDGDPSDHVLPPEPEVVDAPR